MKATLVVYICLDKDLKNTVLKTIFNPPKTKMDYYESINFDEFAHKLMDEFPEKIIEYYWKKAYQNIVGGNRRTYCIAESYLDKAKHLYYHLQAKSNWEDRFATLKREFKNRPAFLDEVKNL